MFKERSGQILFFQSEKVPTEHSWRSAGQPPLPTLDERANLYLRAIHGRDDFTDEEYSNARNLILDAMAAEVADNAEMNFPEKTLGVSNAFETANPRPIGSACQLARSELSLRKENLQPSFDLNNIDFRAVFEDQSVCPALAGAVASPTLRELTKRKISFYASRVPIGRLRERWSGIMEGPLGHRYFQFGAFAALFFLAIVTSVNLYLSDQGGEARTTLALRNLTGPEGQVAAIIPQNDTSHEAVLRPLQQVTRPDEQVRAIPQLDKRYGAVSRPTQAQVTPSADVTPLSAAASPTASAAERSRVYVVASGDTLSKIARHYQKPVSEIAKANNIQGIATLNVGDRLVIPGATAQASRPTVAASVAQGKPVGVSAPVKTEPTQTAAAITPTDWLDKDAARLAEGTVALPKFRWPANGRVIAGYGPTPNGQQNDGINIALPENTPVKAAEDGVVAYAGNELKGYGNLVLVRHPNGYVTAYAHAKELLVKRGDQVKRGQVIARSGQTGNVNAPQLHFEIRKGASPLDPTRFLNGA